MLSIKIKFHDFFVRKEDVRRHNSVAWVDIKWKEKKQKQISGE